MANENLNKSIEELENDFWDEPEFNSSLVINCHAYRKIPLNQIKPEQIRLLMGQDIGIKHLLPLALKILEDNPHFECAFFPGDLLLEVSGIKAFYWNNEKEMYDLF